MQAIKDLRNNDDIVIKPADKGGAIVVMTTDNYRTEALHQLNNTHYYIPLDYPIYAETAEKIFAVLVKMRNNGYLSDRQVAYLKPNLKKAKPRSFYLLPKIHKSRDKWPHPLTPAGRPIVSDCASESSRICEYIDYFLQPLSIRHEAYLKDTYDFIDKVRDFTIEPDWLLVTADVEALYTNMTLDRIISTIRQRFTEFPDRRRSDLGILQLLELTLKNNDFVFDNKYYLQVCGIAMGRSYAPAAANIYLLEFDDQAKNGFRVKPKLYGRFLDDIFTLWPGSRAELAEYESYLNQLIPGIKVTFTVRHQIIEFLDSQVYKHKGPDGRWSLQTMSE